MKKLLFLLLAVTPLTLRAEEPVVQAVVFVAPTCPDCRQFEKKVWPKLKDEFGHKVEIQLVDITTPAGEKLYRAAMDWLPIPPDKKALPALIVQRNLIVGSAQIQKHFPSLIRLYLDTGGAGYPLIPGLKGTQTSQLHTGPAVTF